MTREEISTALRRAMAAMAAGSDTAAHEEVSHPERVSHMYGQRHMQGAAPLSALGQMMRTAFSDLQGDMEDLLVDGDRAAVRIAMRGTHTGPFMGIAPTGKAVQWESLGIAHFRDGKLYQVWVQPDLLGLLRQLGADVPALASH